mgnify:CR=1 FL=1|jgi:hypothetical protein
MNTIPTPNRIIDLLGGTAQTATLAHSGWTTVSEWRKLKKIPLGKMILLAYPLEVASNGRYDRKRMFPTLWRQIWPELESK